MSNSKGAGRKPGRDTTKTVRLGQARAIRKSIRLYAIFQDRAVRESRTDADDMAWKMLTAARNELDELIQMEIAYRESREVPGS